MKTLYEIVPANIKRFRELRGLNKAQAAKAAGMAPQTWGPIEDGKKGGQPMLPSLASLADIAKALDVSVADLIAEDPRVATVEKEHDIMECLMRVMAVVFDQLDRSVTGQQIRIRAYNDLKKGRAPEVDYNKARDILTREISRLPLEHPARKIKHK